jgi:hypothetical protein
MEKNGKQQDVQTRLRKSMPAKVQVFFDQKVKNHVKKVNRIGDPPNP